MEATLTWMAVIMAGISLIDTVVGRVLGYFEKRDAKKFDQEMAMTKASNERCEQQHAEAKRELAEVRGQLATSEAKHTATQRERDADRERIAALERAIAEVAASKPAKG